MSLNRDKIRKYAAARVEIGDWGEIRIDETDDGYNIAIEERLEGQLRMVMPMDGWKWIVPWADVVDQIQRGGNPDNKADEGHTEP